MVKFYATILLLFFCSSLNAQTFSGTGGSIPDNGAAPTCFNINVTGVGAINGSYGVASVCLNITHTYDADLEIKLRAPDGTLIPLSIQNGDLGANYTGTCFTGSAVNPITLGTAPFTGNYKAEGILGNVNNGQNANGTWSLCIQDVAAADAGTLANWNITFNNTPAQPLAPPANDDPCNAIALTANSTCTYSNYTNEGATNSTVADPGCGNYQGSDVWFKVTVPAGGALNFDTQTGVMTDGGMAIYSGANCNALMLIACDDDASTNGLMPMIKATGLTPGSTVWVRVWEYGNDNPGTFGICVVAPVPPPPLTNDGPCTAIPLTATTSCSYTTYTNAGATGTTGVPAPGCSSYSGGDIWFTVTVPAGGALTIDTQDDVMTDGGMALYSGPNCNTLSLIACDDDGSSNGLMPMIKATGLTPGSTVWIRMWEYGNDNNGTFGICATIPVLPPACTSTAPAGNTCAQATPICNFNGYCGNTSATYTADYWTELYDAFDACLGGGTSIENNSFISFVASATSASFNVWVSNSFWGDGIQLMFYSGGCGSGPVTCHGGYNNVIDGPNLISASGLVPGNTYYLMIDGVAGDVCDYTFDPVTGVDALNVNPDVATICAGASINLAASGGNGTYTWSPGAGLNTTSGANVIATPASSTTYTVTSTGTGLCPVTLTKQVFITVTTPPAAPVTSPVTYCIGATATALTATGSNLLWYTAASGGAGSSTAPVPSTASAGTVTYYVSQSNGSCESPRAAITVTVKTNITSTTNVSVCPAQLPYNWNGNNYNAAGSYVYHTTSAGGCDSAVTLNLTLKTNTTSTTNTSVCPAQLPYNWNGNNYNAAGSYVYHTTNAAGCDSAATLNLTVKANTTSTTNVSVCPAQLPYNWNGNNYNAAGSFAVTLVNAAGCDSIANLNLTIKTNTTSTANISVCPAQLPYNWNGNNYNAAGSYVYHTTNAAGCDSAATLNLTVKANTTSTTNISVCPAQLPYNWNGNNYNATGSFSVTLVNAAGCDSIATLNLTVKTNTTSTTNASVCPAQLPYNWNGNNYNAAGSYVYHTTNAAGCDSAVTLNLTVKTNTSSTTNASVCPAQLPYSWNGNNYNAAGSYVYHTTNAAGCDSAATLNLTVKANTTSTTNISVCPAQLPYNWNGNNYNAAGSFTVTLANAAGCDSTATLNLTVSTISASTTNASICTAQLPYNWNGNNYNAAGSYSVTLVGSSGCDSIATLNLTVKANTTSTTNISVCPAQLPYNWNGNNYNATGSFSVTLINAPGCDSIATLNLTVKANTNSTTNISVCPAQLPYNWNGNNYNAPGSYVYHTTNAAGCDSAATLNLTVKTNTTSTTNISVCPAQLPYNWNGNNYNAAGSFAVTLVNAAGCDSIATLNLTLKTNTTSTTNVSVCPAQLPYNWNGNNYNAPGSYVYHTTNAAGCDSAATLNLTVKTNTTSTTNITVCPAQLPYNWNGNNYNAAGSFPVTLVNAAGCDSVATLNLTVSSVSASTTNVSICSAQLPYNWNGNNYNTNGSYSVTLIGSSGCDSIATLNLTVKTNTTSTTNTSLCPSQLPYNWNGNNYNAAGSFAVTLVNAAGCDSIATLNLTLKTNTTSTTNVSVCPAQLPYNWNGNNYNSAGSFAVTLVNAAGCDSVATLNLIVKTNTTSTTNISVCPAQLPYFWNGNNYNVAGSFSVTLVNAAGCDSVATLNLTVSSVSASTTNISICAAQLPYSWNSNNYNSAGSYSVTLVGNSGCDSIATLNLTVKANTTSTTNISVCPAQLPYNWNGNSYNSAGSYSVTLISSSGCDSIATLNLSVSVETTSTTNTSVCATLLPYTWNGNNYNTSGSYIYHTTNAAGCDSAATLNLTVLTETTSSTNVKICVAALPYTWNGNPYNSSGTYVYHTTNAAGCDSAAILVLAVDNATSSTTNIGVCPSQLPYLWNGNNYNAAGNYSVTLTNSSGCDSVATLNLTVSNTSSSTTNVNVCQSTLPYNWNGNNYNAAGSYSVTLVGSTGCDSISTLNLSISNATTSVTNINICSALLPYSWNGNNYNSSGSYVYHSTNAAGCDSAAILNLTVLTETSSTTTISVCNAALPYAWNGNLYSTGGTYVYQTLNSAGCDSAATLILSINNTTASTTTIGVCPSQLPYSWNGNSYNGTGTYSVTLSNAAGCDSIATLNLTVSNTSNSNTNINICQSQLPYSWNGNSYAFAGTYSVSLTGTSGCDSIATLNLIVSNESSSVTNISLCAAYLPYTWNGNSHNAAGSYVYNTANAAGCDSVATLNLTILNETTSTTNASVCAASLPYTWNGNSYNTTGSYTYHTTNAVGCDSAATLVLTVNNATNSTTNIGVCPSQLPYSWNGNTYNSAGTYSAILTNAAGCDSIATLNLSVSTVSSSTENASVCQAQLPYSWNGNSYSMAGTYSVTLPGSSGCDSVITLVLTVNSNTTSTTDITICNTQLPYNWNSNSYNSAGTYIVTLVNTAGCDSIATLNLTVNNAATSSTDITICNAQLPYSWNGNNYNAAGSYNAMLVSASGCDSIATLNLTVNNAVTSSTDIAICNAQLPYSWNGNSYNAAGSYNAMLVSASGCDSIATLNLTVNNAVTSVTDINICPVQLPYSWNGNSYSAAGSYNVTLASTSGCDSIATLNLTVNAVVTSATDVTICTAQLPYSWNGNSYNTAGSYNITLVNAAGCDSVATLNLSVNPVVNSTTNIAVCNNQLPYAWNGNNYNAAGAYSVSLTNIAGCDSVATLNLTVNNTTRSTANISVCNNQLPYRWNGNNYNVAGAYNVILSNAAGCDSIATLNLAVSNTAASTTNITICNTQLPYRWNGNNYNTAGSYTATLNAANGCDSVATLNLAVNNAVTSTTNIAVCPAQLPYSWNGNNYNTTGNYAVTLVGITGCDSIASLNLTVKTITTSTTNIGVCPAQLPYNWNGNSYNAGGSYTAVLTNIAGCDSIATLNLAVKANTSSTTNISVCQAQLPYSWNGNLYSAEGTYSVTLVNSAGCDSIASLKLFVFEAPVVSLGRDTSICPGEKVVLNPGSYTRYLWQDLSASSIYIAAQEGYYTVTVTNEQGCDATTGVNIKINDGCGDIFFPNAIAPNGINRTFGPLGNLRPVSNYSLSIYNRYGELVFSTHDPHQRWDGIYKLKQWGNTNFVWYADYLLNGKQKRKQKGNLLIVW